MIRRMQQRRGTESDWTTANPILASGEFGFETDTGKFKIGNGNTAWTGLNYFATLTAIKSELVDGAPAALDTLNELAAAINDDSSYAATLTGLLGAKAPLNSPTFSGTVNFANALVTGITLPINWMGTFSDSETYAENDMVHYNGSVYYATGENLNNSEGYYPTSAGADWELFASVGDNATVDVGNTYVYNGGDSFVINTGTTQDAVFDFYLAPGPQGDDGGFDTAQAIQNLTSTITLEDVDAGTLKTNTGAGGDISVVIAATSGPLTQLGVGKQVDFVQTSTYQFVFSAAAGITLYSKGGKLKTAGQYSPATIKCIASNTYVLIGDIGD